MQFTDEELADIKWLALLVKAGALADRNDASRMSLAYPSREAFALNYEAALSKIARCDAILRKFEQET